MSSINHVAEGDRLRVPVKDPKRKSETEDDAHPGSYGYIGRNMPECAVVVDEYGQRAFLTPEMVRDNWDLLLKLRRKANGK